MKYIINHSRFKKRFSQKEAERLFSNPNKLIKFPQYDENYYIFFNTYAKNNYKLVDNNCLCKTHNDVLLSLSDRHCVDFLTVVCKNCGLIRAKNYFREKDIIDFYKNYYRTEAYKKNIKQMAPREMFDKQKSRSQFRFDLINEYKIKQLNNLKIIDLGGGVGGVLDHFNDSNQKYLFDFYDPYLEFAETKGIKSTKGGLDKIDFKPDIIILSHVIEHWNNFEYEIQKLINIQKKNETINYIEFPGVDSLKKGRREGDILGDIHVPHVYYFTSYVFENLMNRYGFEKIYIDTRIKSIFIYTGKIGNLVNHYELCYKDLIAAEKTRKFQIFKNLIKKYMPTFIIRIFRKMKNRKFLY